MSRMEVLGSGFRLCSLLKEPRFRFHHGSEGACAPTAHSASRKIPPTRVATTCILAFPKQAVRNGGLPKLRTVAVQFRKPVPQAWACIRAARRSLKGGVHQVASNMFC